MDSLAPELSDELVKFLEHRALLSYFITSSTVILLYDCMLMFPIELEHVWQEQMSLLNVLYVIQRYMPFLDTLGILYTVFFRVPIGADTCRILYNTSGWMYTTGIVLSEVILTMRTWALWGRDKRLTIGLPIFFLCVWIPYFWIMNEFFNSQSYLPSPFPNMIGCVILGGKPVLFVCWVLLIVYEAGILVLMLVPGFTLSRSNGLSALRKEIYKDGIAYYIYLFVLSLINVMAVLTLSHDLENLFNPYLRVIQSLLTSRVILHIRIQSRSQSCNTPTVSFAGNSEVRESLSVV